MSALPSGTVTFLFTDIEGSTKLLRERGDEYAEMLAEHRRLLRKTFAAHRGVEVDTQGDAFFYAFARSSDAVAAASEGQSALESGPIRVRMGLHTGEPTVTDEGYVGIDVHKAARICSAGHGGQILASEQCVSLAEGQTFTDLGLHRLKDLSRPEHIFQLGTRGFPPLKTLHLTNLPIQVTPFIGREREVHDVFALIDGGGFRLVTLTGPGGIGKSRLALQCAAEISSSYPDGVWWVGLSAIRDAQLVEGEVARAIGSNNGLRDHIASKRMLVVFDNFEHLTEASSLLSDLLSACPNMGILTTSRERLHLSAEREYIVPPLTDAEAVMLFQQRAASAAPDDTTRAICLRLDRLPLAIELAAARTKALSAEQILGRLDQRLPLLTGGPRDAPERQRTLRATIEWSFGLLPGGEQALFASLAVFEGGCTLDAAESVCNADLDRLQSLVEKNLVLHADERFFMLETISEYARDLLDAQADVDALRRRHLDFFLAFAAEASANLDPSRKEAYWLDRLRPDHDNFRAALRFARMLSEGEAELRLALALRQFWTFQGHLSEGRGRLAEALTHYPGAAPALRGQALLAGSSMAWRQGDLEDTVARAEEALILLREAEDLVGVARCFNNLGIAAYLERDFVRARRMYKESMILLEDNDDEFLRADLLHNIALVEFEEGHYEEARSRLELALIDDRKRDSERRIANTIGDLGYVAIAQDRDAEARDLLIESLRLVRRLGWKENIHYCLIGLAWLEAKAGALERGAILLGAARALSEEVRLELEPFGVDLRARAQRELESRLGDAEFARFFAEGRGGSLDDAVTLALGESPA